MNTLDEHVVVASPKTPHRRFSAVAAFFDGQHDDGSYWLADANGGGVELPAELWGLLRDAARALAGECGVTVGSVPATLGLQEAAEFASIPLPTLLQCVSDGSIPLSENLVGADETDTVALKDVVKLREYLHRQREAAQQSFAGNAPISVPPNYPEPTIGPSPISASPALSLVSAPPVAVQPTSVPPAPISAEWQEFEDTGRGAAPVSPVAGHNPTAPPAPVRARTVARATVRMRPPIAPPPVSAPSVKWAASWNAVQPHPSSSAPAGAAEGEYVLAAATPVSTPPTWCADDRS